MNGWDNFFIAQVGASATPAGLVFVGVSINLTKIMASPRLPDYALEAIIVLLNVLVVSSLMLVPGQPPALPDSHRRFWGAKCSSWGSGPGCWSPCGGVATCARWSAGIVRPIWQRSV